MKVKVSAAEGGSGQEKKTAPGLGLYITTLRRTIRLNRNVISVGNSKFRDLDLSQVPGGEKLPAHCGDFLYQEDGWVLRPGKTANNILLNHRPMGSVPVKLAHGDRIELVDGFTLVVRSPEAPGVNWGSGMDRDFVLMFQSISATHGHIGIQVRYDAARRMLIREDWGVLSGKTLDNPPVECPVPDTVTTQEELYDLANRKMGERCELPEKMHDQDVLLWLSQEKQVQYVADKCEVLYRQWLPDSPEAKDSWCRFARTCPDEEKIRDYARRTWSHFPHNRKGELDDDLILSAPYEENKLMYHAERREVVFVPSEMEKYRGKKPGILAIPETILKREDLDWYLKINALEWLPRYAKNDDMIRDEVIASGTRWKGLTRIPWETRYRAADRTVVHVADLSKPDEVSEPLKIPFRVFAKQFLPQYVKEQRPDWMK